MPGPQVRTLSLNDPDSEELVQLAAHSLGPPLCGLERLVPVRAAVIPD